MNQCLIDLKIGRNFNHILINDLTFFILLINMRHTIYFKKSWWYQNFPKTLNWKLPKMHSSNINDLNHNVRSQSRPWGTNFQNLKGNRQVVLKLQPDRSMTIQNWLKLPGDTLPFWKCRIPPLYQPLRIRKRLNDSFNLLINNFKAQSFLMINVYS